MCNVAFITINEKTEFSFRLIYVKDAVGHYLKIKQLKRTGIYIGSSNSIPNYLRHLFFRLNIEGERI